MSMFAHFTYIFAKICNFCMADLRSSLNMFPVCSLLASAPGLRCLCSHWLLVCVNKCVTCCSSLSMATSNGQVSVDLAPQEHQPEHHGATSDFIKPESSMSEWIQWGMPRLVSVFFFPVLFAWIYQAEGTSSSQQSH